MPSPDKTLVRIAFEEFDDPYPAGRFRNDVERGQIRDQKADPRGAELGCGWLDAVGNHAEAAFGGHRGGEFGRPDAAEHRELEGKPAADELGEADSYGPADRRPAKYSRR